MDFIIHESKHWEFLFDFGLKLPDIFRNDYPNFDWWYFEKVFPDMLEDTSRRRMFVAVPSHEKDTIAGFIILKDTENEKKICTLYVFDGFRSCGLGTQLIAKAISVLCTTKPLITVSSRHVAEYEPLFFKFGFLPYKNYPDYYVSGVTEISYNGPINI